MYPKSFSLFSSVLFITLPISSAYASYDATTNTETLTNQRISNTMGDTTKGDLKSYNYPDRNLVITWTDSSRGDGSPIRDADVYAKKITIISDFVGNQWTDKGIISDNSTNIHASGDFSIITHDDSVYILRAMAQRILMDLKNWILLPKQDTV